MYLKKTKDHLASRGLRFTNRFVDQLVIILITLGVIYFLDYPMSNNEIFIITYLCVIIGYYVIMESLVAQSLGKMITRTIVVNETGKKIGFIKALVRTFCRLVPFNAFSFLGGKRGWHDTISKTYVVPKNYLER